MMRDKRRYILVEQTDGMDMHDRINFERKLYGELLRNLGEINYHRANPKVLKYISPRRFILRCSLKSYKDVIIALTFIKRLGENDTAFYTLNASGTILALTKPKDQE